MEVRAEAAARAAAAVRAEVVVRAAAAVVPNLVAAAVKVRRTRSIIAD